MYPQSLQDPKMGGSRLAKMADEEEELGTSGHEVEHPPMAGGAGEKGDDERVSSEKIVDVEVRGVSLRDSGTSRRWCR